MSTLSLDNSLLSERLIELINHYNMTESQLARAIQIPRGTINRLKLGKITNPRTSTLTVIAKYFNISIDQLLGYEPLPFYDTAVACVERVPIFSWEQLLTFKNRDFCIGDISPKQWIHFESEHESAAGSLFALKVEGEAMWPYFDDKSVILIDYLKEAQNRSFVIAYIAETDELILRQLLIDGKSKMLHPLNSAFASLQLGAKDHILGVVAHVQKSF